MRARYVSILAPVVIAVLGVVWIQTAVWHFERLTGREMYMLAGYHYSVPEWGFRYHVGGERIHEWTTIVPPNTTFAALLVSLITAIVLNRRGGWRLVAVAVAVHAVVAGTFAFVAACYDLLVTGIFI